ncbi:MAG: nucleotidyl transferase AbiEii/AbiGii toxin family protein [Myxococcales bacterium]|jgi:predicted nucleotidyltransferase component of viral defense system
MTKGGPRDVSASVRARLLNIARAQGEDFQLVLTRYANERLLYRLAKSQHAPSFILKGAALFTLWTGKPHRATRDLDLLGFGNPGVDHVREVIAELIRLDVPDDGVRYDPSSLNVGLIREEQEYGGVRAELFAYVTAAKVRLQIDVGFGDAVTPDAEEVEFPALLDFPAPKLRAYPRETVVAEKLEAIAQLGIVNTRMKDFYDLAVLARDFEFKGDPLVRAIRATFERRKTPLPDGLPTGLTAEFAEEISKQSQWTGFMRKTGARDFPALGDAIGAAAAFAEEPLAAAATGARFHRLWPSRGPWNE